MAAARINRRLRALDMAEVEAYLMDPIRVGDAEDEDDESEDEDDDLGFEVCEVSRQDWIRFVKSENQAFPSRYMCWHNGRVYTVELPSWVHDKAVGFFSYAISHATGTGTTHLEANCTAYVHNLAHIEPDMSFAPAVSVGATVPPGIGAAEFCTLKVEIGVSRGWRQLNHKAEKWRAFPGVEYVLCIRISPARRVRQYRLFSVVGNNFKQPVMPVMPIVNPATVNFDSHRLLGLPAAAPLPAGFANPFVSVDLWPCIAQLLTH